MTPLGHLKRVYDGESSSALLWNHAISTARHTQALPPDEGAGRDNEKFPHLGSELIQTPPWQHRRNNSDMTNELTAYSRVNLSWLESRTRHRDEHPSIAWSGHRHLVPNSFQEQTQFLLRPGLCPPSLSTLQYHLCNLV